MWHKKQIRLKNDKVVVKLYEEDVFKKSVIVPTVYYPLNGNYEVFHYENTEKVADENVLKIFDSMKYRVGHCYQNTDALVTALRDAGYDAVAYVGWLFVCGWDYPVHHCWCVLDGKYVLDLSDDYSVMMGLNAKAWENVKTKEEQIELIASFTAEAKKHPHSIRCAPVGTPTPFLYYVGCPCDPEEGRKIYQRLIRDYPDHECQRNCDKNGLNQTQKRLKELGLM